MKSNCLVTATTTLEIYKKEEKNQLNGVCLFHQICHIIFKLPRETVHIGFSTSAILDFQLSHTVVDGVRRLFLTTGKI